MTTQTLARRRLQVLARTTRAALSRVGATPRSGETIELEDAFDDASLEMDASGEQFRVAAALQAAIVAAADAADDAAAAAASALTAAAAAQADATAALAAAAAAENVDVYKAGVLVGSRPTLNIIDGTGATATVADNAGADRIDITFNAPGSASILTGNPFIDPPTAPNAFDDEFTGNPDLAVRGWTVKTSGGTTLTRAGDINPWDTTGPAAGTYWSTIVGSWLFFQGPASTTCYIYKSISLSVGDLYFARMGYSGFVHNSGASAKYVETGFYGSSSGNLDLNNRVYCSDYEQSGAPHKADIGRNTAGAFAGSSRDRWLDADIRGVRYTLSTANYHGFFIASQSGEGLCLPLNSAMSATNVAFFAVGFTSGPAGTTPNVGCLDFIRKKTGGVWIVP